MIDCAYFIVTAFTGDPLLRLMCNEMNYCTKLKESRRLVADVTDQYGLLQQLHRAESLFGAASLFGSALK